MGFSAGVKIGATRFSGGVVADLVRGGFPMTDTHDLSEGFDPSMAESAKRGAKERQAAEDQAFTDKLAKRSPPDPIERAEIKKARKRTKARAPRIAMHIEDRGTGGPVVYPDH